MSNMLVSLYEIDGNIKIDNFKSNLSIFITPFSITHFTFGYMTQAFGINYLYGLILHTIYEYSNYKNYTLQKKWSEDWKGFKSDSITNSVGDTLCFIIGMFVAKKYNNLYLFIFIFLVGLLFYSQYFKDYLTNTRLDYLKSKYNTIKKSVFDSRKNNYNNGWFICWIIVSLATFIKLKISNKKF